MESREDKLRGRILVIAGSDPSGGAGIQADIKTITALNGYAMTAITAVTAQNTTGVKSIVPIPSNEILNQINFTIKDIKPNAIKIGMLHSSKVIESVISSLKRNKIKKIVLDPVMVAKGGTKLIDDKAIKVLRDKLIKKVTLITPNIPEAEVLTEIMKNAPEEIKLQMSDNINWIKAAKENKMVVGSQARILYADAEGRIKIAEAFFYLHTQDRSCWTHELQLTPFPTKPSF